MSGIGSIANLSLRVLTIYDLVETVNDDEVKDTVVGLVALATSGPAGLANAALNSTNTTGILSSGMASFPRKHHTVPEYLCGHSNQVLSAVPHHEHVKIHAALYALRVSAINGQKLIIKKIMRRPTKNDKNQERILLGGNPMGRRIITKAIEYVYEWGDWMHTGNLPIGIVFDKEKRKYEMGHTSYPACKKGAK